MNESRQALVLTALLVIIFFGSAFGGIWLAGALYNAITFICFVIVLLTLLIRLFISAWKDFK